MSVETTGPMGAPPGLAPQPEIRRRYAGLVGFWLSLAAPVAYLSITIWKPG